MELLRYVEYGVYLAVMVSLAASHLVRVILLDIIRHPFSKTRIEIHDKKDITVRIA